MSEKPEDIDENSVEIKSEKEKLKDIMVEEESEK